MEEGRLHDFEHEIEDGTHFISVTVIKDGNEIVHHGAADNYPEAWEKCGNRVRALAEDYEPADTDNYPSDKVYPPSEE